MRYMFYISSMWAMLKVNIFKSPCSYSIDSSRLKMFKRKKTTFQIYQKYNIEKIYFEKVFRGVILSTFYFVETSSNLELFHADYLSTYVFK